MLWQPQKYGRSGITSGKSLIMPGTLSLAMRLKSNRCEWCGKETTALLVHQVKMLKELGDKEAWAVFMKKINRKTLVVCEDCHLKIHRADCE